MLEGVPGTGSLLSVGQAEVLLARRQRLADIAVFQPESNHN